MNIGFLVTCILFDLRALVSLSIIAVVFLLSLSLLNLCVVIFVTLSLVWRSFKGFFFFGAGRNGGY